MSYYFQCVNESCEDYSAMSHATVCAKCGRARRLMVVSTDNKMTIEEIEEITQKDAIRRS